MKRGCFTIEPSPSASLGYKDWSSFCRSFETHVDIVGPSCPTSSTSVLGWPQQDLPTLKGGPNPIHCSRK